MARDCSRPHIFALLLAAAALSGCGPVRPQPKIIRLAYTSGPSELLHRASLRLAEQVKAESGGRLSVRLYPGGQLGNERELMEGLRLGYADAIVTGLAIIGWYAPEYGAFETPFLWRDYDHLSHDGAENRACFLTSQRPRSCI